MQDYAILVPDSAGRAMRSNSGLGWTAEPVAVAPWHAPCMGSLLERDTDAEPGYQLALHAAEEPSSIAVGRRSHPARGRRYS
jgi:hypothetical protein